MPGSDAPNAGAQTARAEPSATGESTAEQAEPAPVDDPTRVTSEGCACISRTAVVKAENTPGGVRLVLTPYHQSDLERLERRIGALEDAPSTDACNLPALMKSAEDVDIEVVSGTVHVDLVAPAPERERLRKQVRKFAHQVAAYGVVAPELTRRSSSR